MNKELLIQKYFKGTLNAEEQQSFDQLMAGDKGFVDEVAEYEDIQKAIRESERQALKVKLLQIESNLTENTSTVKIKRFWPLAIAAALAIFLAIAGILSWPTSDNSAQLYATYFEPYPNALKPIKRGQETIDLDIQAFLAYEEGDYEVAVEKFETILAENDNPDIRFYHAMSLQSTSKLEQALYELKQIDGKTTKFQPQIIWYLALIYIKKEDWQSAEKMLEKLVQMDTLFKQEEAKALLAQLPRK